MKHPGPAAATKHCCSILDVVESSPQTDKVRRAAFGGLRSGTPLTLTELATATRLDVADVRDVVGRLVAAGTATIDGDLAQDPPVVGADGLTVVATPHRLALDGHELHTWCGFDGVGISAALGAAAVASTTCPGCGAGIELVLVGGRPPESAVVGWWPLEVSGPVNESFCPTASLFCTSEHLDAWRPTAPGPGEALELTELAERGRTNWSLFTDHGDQS